MAIKEFIIGPQDYFEAGYFDGDYTVPNVSRSFLECDVDKVRGGRVITGEYYLGEYIDGSYYHNNSSSFNLTVDAMVVQEATIALQSYYQEGYYEAPYYESPGSYFTLTAELEKIGQTVEANGAWSSAFSQDASAGKITEASISLDAAFTQTAYGQRDRDIDLFAFSDAALELQVDRLRDNNIIVSAVFDIATDGRIFRDIISLEDGAFTLDVFIKRSRAFSIETQAAFSLTCSAREVIIPEPAIFVTISSIETTVDKIKNVSSTLSSSFTVSSDVIRNKGIVARLSAFNTVMVVGEAYEAVWNQRTWIAGLNVLDSVQQLDGFGWYHGEGQSSVAVDDANEKTYEIRGYFKRSTSSYGFYISERNLRTGESNWEDDYELVDGTYTLNHISEMDYYNGNLYFAISGRHYSSQVPVTKLYKYNIATKSISWAVNPNMTKVYTVKVNNGSIYAAGGYLQGDATYTTSKFNISKFNTSGTRLWYKHVNGYDQVTSIGFYDTYIYAVTQNINGIEPIVAKLNQSDGSFVVTKRTAGTGYYGYVEDASLAVSPTGDVYVWAKQNSESLVGGAQFLKLNSNLEIVAAKQIRRVLDGTTIVDTALSMTFASDGDLIIALSQGVMKISSDLSTIKWVNRLTYGSPDQSSPEINFVRASAQNKFIWSAIPLDLRTSSNQYLSLTALGRSNESTGGALWSDILFRDGILYQGNPPGQVPAYWSWESWTSGAPYLFTINVTTYDVTPLASSTYTFTTTGPELIPETTISYSDYIYYYTVNAIGSWSSSFTGTFTVGQVKGTSVNLSSSFTTNVVGRVARLASATASIVTSQTTTVRKIARVNSSLSTTASMTVSGQRIRYIDSNISSQFSQTTDAIKRVGIIDTLSSTSDLSIIFDRFRDTSSDFESIATELAAVSKNATGTITLESTSALTATANKQADESHFINSEFSLTVSVDRRRNTDSQLDSLFALDIIFDKLQPAGSQMDGEFAVSVNTEDSKITRVNSNLTSQAALTADTVASRIRTTDSDLSVVSSLVVNNQVLRLVQATLASEFRADFTITYIIRVTADFHCEGFTLTVGDVINIDPFLQIRVAQETRQGTVLPEQRTILVEQETRVNIIQGYRL